ncbi:MAG: TIGR01212 family radical SAM protein [Candidatus Cryptobacteroides sp.]|nr:TIGR01212 family radical SAM protein [Candidatus Cryptobacteroides sp.]
MFPDFPEGKRYNTFAGYYKRIYGERLQKLVIDAGFTCPNRDGKVGRGGCSFCDNAAFHPGYSVPGKFIADQIDEGISFHRVRYRNTRHYLAYFQSYSNTYAPLPRLVELYSEALSHPSVVGIVIGTRPDCVDEEKLDWLASLKDGRALPGWRREGFGKPVVKIEYGIESCYDRTLERVGRGHDVAAAVKALAMSAERGLEPGAHFILGLPGETREMLLDQCSFISSLPLHSVKFHQLQIVRGTRIEKEFEACPGDFLRLSLDGYLDLVTDILERLRPGLYIERVAGEVPPRFVKDTAWGLIRNFQILHLLDDRLEARNAFQGRLFPSPACR